MRYAIASAIVACLAACASVQHPARAPVSRAALSAKGCDSAASIAAERANLASVARSLGDLSMGSEANAYATLQQGIAVARTSDMSPSRAAAASDSMGANANGARVQLLYTESRQDQVRAQIVARQIAALDTVARRLPALSTCRAAGFASGGERRG